MKQSHIREWEEINRLDFFKWTLIQRKKVREIKDTVQRRHNSQEYATLYWSGTKVSKFDGKLRKKKFSEM